MVADYAEERLRMVQQQIIPRGVRDPATIAAMRTVPRHAFVPHDMQAHAYDDSPLPIGEGQTISQPYIVALMTESAQIDSNSVVLEIGTGSGYAAAILSQIAKEVYTVERIPELAHEAAERLTKLGYANVHVKVGDGTLGWPEHAPYDAILVTAGAPVVPHSFIPQLKLNGKVIIPVGDAMSQQLLRLHKIAEGKYASEFVEFVRFVPLIGEEGWHED